MRLSLVRIFAALQLMRIPLAAGAAVNLMFAAILARLDPAASDLPVSTLPLWAVLFAAAVVGSGLFGFAAGMNDLLDARRDQTFQRNRPLSSGRLTTPQATLLTFCALFASMVGANMFGESSVRVAIFTAFGIAMWNAMGRFVPAVGLLMLGLAQAGSFFIPWMGQPFTLPASLILVQTIATGSLLHKVLEKRPRLDRSATILLAFLAAAAIAGLAWLSIRRGAAEWPEGDAWRTLPPIAAMAIFAWQSTRALAARDANETAGLLGRAAAMFPPMAAAAWMLSIAQTQWCVVFTVFAAMLWALSWLAREVHEMIGQATAWRG
ncbi:MAG: hypothetical protein K8R92_05200 [Planctomycetes bacterium]|nr:hypothetical protein [Planctomycetota bacterium]